MSRLPGASAPALAGLLVALLALLGAVPATAQNGTAADGSPGTEAARRYFTDTVLVNQDGEPVVGHEVVAPSQPPGEAVGCSRR